MDKALKLSKNFLVAVLLGFFLSGYPVSADEAQEKVILDADRVSYNDETGQARAEGRAVLKYKGAVINAERIDYDAVSQKVNASSKPGEKVELQAAGKHLEGDSLVYDLNSSEGILSGARTDVPVGEGTLYIYGGSIEILPWDLAVERKLVKGSAGEPGEVIAQWQNVALTTCIEDHPHYRIEAKRIVFIPGKSVTAKRPRVYIGSTYIFTSPADMVMRLDRRALKTAIMPYFENRSDHGTGFGMTSSFEWDTGSLAVGFALWSKVGMEWMAEVEQSLGGGFSVKAGASYSWDELWDEKIWRPKASFIYERNKWLTAVNWSRDEYIDDQKDASYKYTGRLDRNPELEITSPWINGFFLRPSWVKLHASVGSYQDKTLNYSSGFISRYGAELYNYAERPLGSWGNIFLNMKGTAWFYENSELDQQAVSGILGLRYGLGVLELGTAYERRYTWGGGGMMWDNIRSVEKLHQMLRFPLGREIFAELRGAYDLDNSRIEDVTYSLQWVTDCMKWELYYYNNRIPNNEDKIGLTMSLLALPNTPTSFGQEPVKNVFERDKTLPEK